MFFSSLFASWMKPDSQASAALRFAGSLSMGYVMTNAVASAE
jgi:hypothetical protein